MNAIPKGYVDSLSSVREDVKFRMINGDGVRVPRPLDIVIWFSSEDTFREFTIICHDRK